MTVTRPLSPWLAGIVLALATSTVGTGAQEAERPRVELETSVGRIEIEVDADAAPVTARNFLRYVDEGFYDDGQFHRTVRMDNQPQNDVKIEVIQASVAAARSAERHDAIPLERTTVTGLRHLNGAVSMARDEPDSARADFFICIGDQPSLDFGGARNPDGQGFAAFGRVVAGMDVVRAIQQSPASAQQLTPPIRIIRARRVP